MPEYFFAFIIDRTSQFVFTAPTDKIGAALCRQFVVIGEMHGFMRAGRGAVSAEDATSQVYGQLGFYGNGAGGTGFYAGLAACFAFCLVQYRHTAQPVGKRWCGCWKINRPVLLLKACF